MYIMKRTPLVPLVLLLLAFVACSSVNQSARQTAHQSLLQVGKSTDLIMTVLGQAYRAGAFGAPGSAQAENVRTTAEKASRAISTAMFGALAALDAGSDTTAYMADITAALAQLEALLPVKHGRLFYGPGPDVADAPQTAELAVRTSRPQMYFKGGVK